MATPVDLTLTLAGYRRMLNKERSGPRLVVTDFAVAQYATDYVPNNTQTALNGSILYRGPIETSVVNQRLDRIYRCLVPDTSIAGSIYEFGLYLDTGELFAVGVLPQRYIKSSPFQLRIYGRIRPPNVNKSVEFDVTANPIISVVSDYSGLPAANQSGPNVYVVQNGHCGTGRFQDYAPTFVCKWKNGDEWALASGSLVYRGPVAQFDVREGKYISVPEAGVDGVEYYSDFAAADVAMLTVIDGPAKYQTRHVVWSASSKRFILVDPKPFNLFLSARASKIAIWAGPGCCGGACVGT